MRERLQNVKDLLWFLVAVGVVAVAFRLWFGLGATTNLDDAVPWGLWKILNMVAGVALATGGFTVGLLVYVLRVKRLRPLMKPAILIAFLGYGSSVAALFFDIGLPHRIWHPIFMWNFSSFLFEVGICVMSYFTITIVELTPVVLERFPRAAPVTHFLHRIAPGVVIVGISLSSLHHSSLGSLFLVTPARLHPLWYSSWLPLLFITSAMGAGMMAVVLARLAYAHWYESAPVDEKEAAPALVCVTAHDEDGLRRRQLLPMLGTLASIAAWVLAFYLGLKVVDLFRTGAWQALVSGSWESWLYLMELLLSAVVPVLMLAIPRMRRSVRGLAVAAGSACAGLLLNRLDVGIFGYFRDAGRVYFPSLAEWAVCLGVLAAAALMFLKAVEELPVFDESWQNRESERRLFSRSFDSFSGVWARALGNRLSRVSLVFVVAVPLASAVLYPLFATAGGSPVVRPPTALDLQRQVLQIDGDSRGMAVKFPHTNHQKRLGGETSCVSCHHLALPHDHATPCSRCHRQMEEATGIFDHEKHFVLVARREGLAGLHPGNHSCGYCHPVDETKEPATAKACLECHQKDMRPAARYAEGAVSLQLASGYRVAMHETCIPCHRARAQEVGRPELGECRHCHGAAAALSPSEV